MRDVRAVVYGVGAMGSILTRLLLDKGVKIVGAVGRSPEKVGAISETLLVSGGKLVSRLTRTPTGRSQTGPISPWSALAAT